MYENISQKRQRPQNNRKLPWFSISFAKKNSGKHSERDNNLVCGKLESVVTFLQRWEVERRKCFIVLKFCARLKTQNFAGLFQAKKQTFHFSITFIYFCVTFTQKKDKGARGTSIFTSRFSNFTKNTDYLLLCAFNGILAPIELRPHWHSNHNQNFDSDESWILVPNIE